VATGEPDPIVRTDVRSLARVCAHQRADGRRTDDPTDLSGDQGQAQTITPDDPGIGTSRKATTFDVEDGQVKTSLDVPLSEAAADALWRIIERARKNQQL